MNLTEEQRAAIEEEGRVIVSASAGSGKTHVMIERLVRLILSRKATVRQVLAVTFTNKAAAQMRDRLRRALLDRVTKAEGEERDYLKAQIADLPLAEISTIHAFCGRLVRARFYLAEVDPAFRVISPDDAEGSALSARALDETFEAAYEEGGEEFYRLLSVYFRKKKDARLRELVRTLAGKARTLADYRSVLARAGEDNFSEVCDYLAEDLLDRAEDLRDRAEELHEFFTQKGHKGSKLSGELLLSLQKLIGEEERYARAEEYIQAARKMREELAQQGPKGERVADEQILPALRYLLSKREDLFTLTARAREEGGFSPTPPSTREEGETLARLKELRALSAEYKELLAELKSYATREEEYARFLDGASRAKALASLALRYDGTYARLKSEAGVLDYDDLEHFALKVLSSEGVAEEVRRVYRYVFVDEYQDVNPAQERILSLLTGEEVFLVGDGKQAIYGFRGSKSEYFYRKAEEYRPKSLRLTQNFRSAPAVLDAVNRVFGPIAEDGVMTGGSLYGDYRGAVGISFAKKAEEEKRPRGVYSVLSERETEEDETAAEVVRLVETELGAPVKDPGGEVRPAAFGDIAILARKNTGDAERAVRALTARDIPVTTTAKVNACDFFEGKLLLDWLSYLDNAEQDIPLASAMLSAVGGFSEDDLAQIRLHEPHSSFRAACARYSRKETDALAARLKEFFARTERYRMLASVRSATEMIGVLLADGLEAQIAAKRGGRGRLARVRRIAAESEGAGSVHAFLSKLRARGFRVDFSESGGEDAVKVLTMHASKGLEYPVVILVGLDAAFHGAEKDELAWTERFLVAPRSYDLTRGIVYDTVLRRASELWQEQAQVREERNIFYVAMTRARCRLHLVFDDREHTYDPEHAHRYSDFVNFAAFSDCRETAELPPEPVARAGFLYRPDPALVRELTALSAWQYPHADSTRLPVKSSATALLREAEEPLPQFTGGGSIEEGLAYHAFLEKVRFGAEAGAELARMREEKLLTEEQLALLDPARLASILALPCFGRLAGKRIRREQTFLVSLPACEVFPTRERDEIVFQGAIDLLAEGEDGYEIYDYKDSGRDDASIREHYRPQIELYRKAVARALKVDERTVGARIVNIRLCREIPM